MIAIILAIMAVLALGMLLFPVTIYVNSTRSGGRLDGIFSIHWIIFLFRYLFKDNETEILVFGWRVIRLPHKEKPEKNENIKKTMGVKRSRKIPHIRDISNLTGPLYRLFKDLARALRLKYFDIDLTFGLEDPAHTGILTGFLHSIRGSLQAGHDISFTPDFTRPILEWDLKAKVTVIPIKILPPVMRFTVSRQVLKSVRIFMG